MADYVGKEARDPLKPLDAWVANNEPAGNADRLMVEVDADHLTTEHIRDLAALGNRHQLAIDVELGSGGRGR